MTSKILSSKKSYEINLIKQSTWLSVLSFLTYLFCITIPTLFAFLEFCDDPRYGLDFADDLADILTVNWFTSISTVVLGIIFATAMFRYLNSKPEVDLYHSLPVKRKRLFLSRFFVGIICFAIPYLANVLFCSLISLIYNVDFSLQFMYYMLNFLLNLLTFTSIYAFMSLSTIATGNNFMALFTSQLLIWSPMAFYGIYTTLADAFYEFWAESNDTWEIINYLNPIMVNFSVMDNSYKYFKVFASDYFYLILQFAVMFIFSFIAFMKRQSENSSNPVALNIFRPIIKFVSVICFGSLGGFIVSSIRSNSMYVTFLIGVFIFGYIIHFILEALFDLDIRTGFKNFKDFLIIYVIFAIFTSVIHFDLTGYDTRFTKSEDIASVTFDNYTLTSEENIERVNSYISSAIENRNNNEISSSYSYSYERITINLKNGTSYTRYYYNFNVDIQNIYDIKNTKEYFMQEFDYTLTESDFENIKASTKIKFITANTSSFQHITYDEFYSLYQYLMADLDLLTEDYIKQNFPVVTIQVYGNTLDGNYHSYNIPIYEINTKALDIIQLEPNLNFDGAYLESYTTNVSYVNQSIIDLCIDNMITVYGYNVYNPINDELARTEAVFVMSGYSYEILGYLPLDVYNSLIN